ncbi:hypothetical protein AXG93_3017s1070 [Marchantia polymorpha subsp. ruderalis]|uniref:NADH-cytochrome b5 reductase n=1 Tax=Marchantia polymorpha subsp. ruderalis TaxID=1480154 RepID=A0A176WGT6_MARPO|nr:hypothetical protein AXG93_3017s1070 [Marchantia polymorpha subsp. ruderalis]
MDSSVDALKDDNMALAGIALAVVAVVVGSAFLFVKLKKKGSLNPEKWTRFILEKKTQVSPNVVKLKFALPTKTSVLGLPIVYINETLVDAANNLSPDDRPEGFVNKGSGNQQQSIYYFLPFYFYVMTGETGERGQDVEGEEVIKPYTPTTLDSDVGFFELVVKWWCSTTYNNTIVNKSVYKWYSFSVLNAKVYEKGRMSGYFGRMKEGDYLECKGPKGRFRYTPNMMRAFGMIAGGTGLTPCYQVTRAILENPKDKTNVSLIYANVTFEDILLKDDLDRMAKMYPDRFKVYYVLNQAPADWQGGVGFVSADMIKDHLPAPAADIQVLRCGPPPMNKAMGMHLDNLGYTKEMQFQF